MARKALLVGVNRYPNPEHRLNGCVNDVHQVRALLERHYGFDGRAALRVLLDAQATTAAIRSGLGWLADGSRAGDVLVFHYSGHGSQVPDRDGDEITDGLDEIICPYDLDWNDPIADDDLSAAVGCVPEGAALTVVLDCCHSGTGLREPLAPDRRDRFMSPPRLAVTVRPRPDRRFARPPAMPAAAAPAAPRPVHRIGRHAAEAGAVLIAGCRDDQSAADAFIDGAHHGALTYFLCLVLADAPYQLSYSRLIRRVRANLRASGFEQDPQLEGAPARLRMPAFAPLPVSVTCA